jgi:MFS transporter, PAT family, beta-lactamase induction signal transducer AmpG
MCTKPAPAKKGEAEDRVAETPATQRKSGLGVWTQPKMLALVVLGFSSGMPLFLTGKTLQAWMTVEGVDLGTIGMMSLVALPYSLKFIWAPLLDRYVPPLFGRRRGWIFIAQVLLLLSIVWMSFHDPRTGLKMVALNAIFIAFFSATQDVAIDAYRTDVLDDKEMGAGAAVWVLGYRIALLITGGFAFFMADRMPWSTVYLLMGLLMIIGMIGTWRAREPLIPGSPPKSLADAVRLPFQEFFQRAGNVRAVLILVFIVLYKLPEYLAQNMATPFLLHVGFSQTEIGAAQGVIGLIATILGTFAGGAAVAKIGINRSLWSFAILGAASNLMFYLLAIVGKNTPLLFASVIVENFCLGLVNGVFVAFLMSMCNVQYSATQFALLSSLMAASRDILVSPAGKVVESTGWPLFFLIALATVLPSLLLLPVFAPWNRDNPLVAATHTGETAPHEVTDKT